MKAVDLKRTIVQSSHAYLDFDYVAMQHEVVLKFATTCKELRESYAKPFDRIIRLLECYLRVTRQALSLAELTEPYAAKVCQGFVAALFCPKFHSVGRLHTQILANAAFELFVRSGVPISEDFRPGFSRKSVLPAQLADAIRAFEAIELDDEQVWLWSAWPSTSRAGRVSHFPLFYVYQRFGRAFTARMGDVPGVVGT